MVMVDIKNKLFSWYHCPICNSEIEAEIEIGGHKRYDKERLHDELCMVIGDHMLAKHDGEQAENTNLKTEIGQLKKDKLELNAQCFHKDETISVLKNRIAELEKAAVVWHKYPEEKPPIDGRYLFWDSDGNAPHVLPYNDIVVRDHPGVFSTQTHWAYLPAPPKE